MNNIIAVLILAGGNSTRMGSPKALLPLPNQQTLLDFHIKNTQQLNLPIFIGDNDKDFLNLNNVNLKNPNINTIKDYIKNAGALSCIISAIDECKNHHSLNDFLMAISCDNLIDIGKIYELYNQVDLKDFEGVYLKDNITNKDYPLLGCYRLSLYDDLKKYLDKGERSVMQFLKDKSICQISMPNDWQYLANFNTPDEYKEALMYFNH